MLRHKIRSDKFGFTLAEVLITLGIIGIVAAMTLPSLINHYRDRQILSQFNAAVSIFSNGFTQMANDNGGDLRNLYGPWNDFRHLGQDFYAKYFKLLKMCIPYGSYKECVPYTFYALDKKTEIQEGVCGTYSHVGILGNGMIFCLSMPGVGNEFALSVDLNGAKGPNTMGYDVFKFFITDAGIVHPRKAPDGGVCELRFKGNPYNGYKCAEWIQKFQNVDYLHYEKLNWTSGEHY